MIDDMEFTTDWVSGKEGWWRDLFNQFKYRPVRMLEVGFFEGRSAQWWLRNAMGYPGSHLTCVDAFSERGKANRQHICSDADYAPKFSFFQDDAVCWASRQLGKGHSECFDAIYIDFSKEALDIVALASIAFRLLKPGGFMLFDDYDWKWSEASCLSEPPKVSPREGIDAFYQTHTPLIGGVRHGHGQVAVWKDIYDRKV